MVLPAFFRPLNNQSGVVPILPILGLLFLTIAIGFTIQTVQNTADTTRVKTRAAEPGNFSRPPVLDPEVTPQPCESAIRRILKPFGVPCAGSLLNSGQPVTTPAPIITPNPTKSSIKEKRFSDLLY